MHRFAICLLLSLASCVGPSEGTSPATIAIRNVTVLDGRGGPGLPKATVLVKNGLIERVIVGRADLPTGTRLIEGSGGFLLPGFIDMHAHLLVPRCEPPPGQTSPFDRQLSEQMLSKLLDFGITAVRSPATPTEEGLALRDDLNEGRVRGPRAFASAELINDSRLDDAQLRAYVREALVHRPDYFKVYARLSPQQVATVVDEAHRHGIPVIGHLQQTSWLEGAGLGIDHLTHAADWSEKTLRPERRAAYAQAIRERGAMRARLDWLELLDLESPEVVATLEEVSRRGLSVDPTLVAYDSKFSDPARTEYRANRFAGVVPELLEDWADCGDSTEDWTAADRQKWEQLLPKLQSLVRRMHERGVLLTTGSDLTNEWVIPGESLHQEFELLAGAGLSASAVLRMTGENSAKALGRTDIGVIERGRRADLVLLAANPLLDIGNTRTIVWVMQNGTVVSEGPSK